MSVWRESICISGAGRARPKGEFSCMLGEEITSMSQDFQQSFRGLENTSIPVIQGSDTESHDRAYRSLFLSCRAVIQTARGQVRCILEIPLSLSLAHGALPKAVGILAHGALANPVLSLSQSTTQKAFFPSPAHGALPNAVLSKMEEFQMPQKVEMDGLNGSAVLIDAGESASCW